MLDALLLSAALYAPANHGPDPDRLVRPSRGGAGRYMDSNVYSVWKGATHTERMVWLCIRNHESRHSGHYTAENPSSTAAGAGQWLNGTWDGLKKWVKVDGKFVARQYDEASDAPAWVQDAAFRHVYKHGGLRMWHGTGCPGT